MVSLNDNPQAVVNALGFVCKRRKQNSLVTILESATASVDGIDHYNDSTMYRVDLEIPFELFIDLGQDREAYEAQLTKYAEEVLSGDSEQHVSAVKLVADLSRIGEWRSGESPLQASTSDVARLWKEGHFRLFLSHSSTDKVFGGNLKDALGVARVDTFVAHEDIEPNLSWQQEIKLALASCHGVLFIATEASNRSWWCQQEIGWGLGRGVLVTSYNLAQDPVGFVGSIQGWKVPDHKLSEISKRLVEMFIKDDRTEQAMHEPLVQLVQSSRHAPEVDFWLDYLELLKSLTPGDLERINNVSSQSFVVKSQKLPMRLTSVLSKFGFIQPAVAQVGSDEYDPFADE